MNPELLNRLRQLLTGQPAAPRDQTRVAAAEDMNFAEEEQRQMAKGKHSPRFHDEGFARLAPEARREAVRQHIAEGTYPAVRDAYLTPSADSAFRATGLPRRLAEYKAPPGGDATEAEYNPAGDALSVKGLPSWFTPEQAAQSYRGAIVHEGRHRAQSKERGFSQDRELPAEFTAMVPYGQRQPEQYAFLGERVYNLLTNASRTDKSKEEILRELQALNQRYPKSPSSAEAIARDLLAGRTTARGGQIGSIFGPEHPLREMLGVPAKRIVGLP